jgi:hypothetical protein
VSRNAGGMVTYVPKKGITSRPVRRIVFLSGIGLGILLLVYLLLNLARCQWDFRTYYFAATAFARGLDPYQLTNLDTVGKEFGFTHSYDFVFLYPFLYLVRPLTLFPYAVAVHLFLLLKLATLAGLLWIWKRRFLGDAMDFLFPWFLLLAFNSPVYADFKVGNISTFEQGLLWLGLFFFVDRKPALFGICIVAASMFKIVPLAFLLLYLVTDERRRYLYFFGSGALFVLLLAAIWGANPTMFNSFLSHTGHLVREGGTYNPSTLILSGELVSLINRLPGISLPGSASWIIWAMCACAVVALTIKTIWALKRKGEKDWLVRVVLLFCFAYALCHPRIKEYGYILLLAPAYFVIVRCATRIDIKLPLLVLAMATGHSILPGINIFLPYLPLFVVYGLWGIFLLDSMAVNGPEDTVQHPAS